MDWGYYLVGDFVDCGIGGSFVGWSYFGGSGGGVEFGEEV